MIHFPNAKINLGLNITSKRNDGYHNIETVFYPIGWSDVLEVISPKEGSNRFNLHLLGREIDCPPEKNLIWKAWNLLNNDYSLPPADFYLRKVIPFGAGLGGGSSDAAHTIMLLNEWADLRLSNEEMARYASKLGADCSFFIYNKPLFASGIGNCFEQIELSLKGYYIILVKPAIFVSTQEAYSLVEPKQPTVLLKEIVRHPVEQWKNEMVNDFEQSVFARYPAIATLKQVMYDCGAVYASMSGSGSSVYGLFKEKTDYPREWNKMEVYADWL